MAILRFLTESVFFFFNIIFKYEWENTLPIRNSRGTNNCVQSVFEKKTFISL